MGHSLDILIYLAIGVGAGLLSGLLGIGGGIIVVPALLMVFQHHTLFSYIDRMHIAVGTSLATMIVTALSSTLAYQRHKAIVWPVFWRMIPGLAIGMLLGSIVTKQLVPTVLIQLFSIFLVINAIHLLINAQLTANIAAAKSTRVSSVRHHSAILIASLLVGVLSALFGIGGGILLVPLFLMLGLTMRQSSGTSSICGMVAAIIGTLLVSTTKLNSEHIYPLTSGYIYWPAAIPIAISSLCLAQLGARLSFRLPIPALKRLFAIILLLSAWNLVTS